MHPLEHLGCRNPRCADAGRRGHGNLASRGSSGKTRRIRMAYCRTGEARSSERTGPVPEQARLPDEKAHAALDPIGEGCGTRATRRLVEVDKDTGTRSIARAGAQAGPLHRERVASSPRDARGPARRGVGRRLPGGGVVRSARPVGPAAR